jgi:lysophospholipase L1-like esterase
VVVLCFFCGNDVCETFQSEQPSDGDAHAVIALGANGQLEVTHRRTRLHMRLLRCSKLFRLWESTALYQRLAHHHDPAPAQGTKGSTLVEDAYWKIELLRISQFKRGASDRPPLDEAWRLVAKNLAALHASVRAAGAKLAVIVMPDEIQVDAKKRAELCRRFNLDEKDFDLDEFERRVAALCASEKVPLVDVLPAFREQGSQGGLYLDLDTHWNAKGHALAASLLAPTLAELMK